MTKRDDRDYVTQADVRLLKEQIVKLKQHVYMLESVVFNDNISDKEYKNDN